MKKSRIPTMIFLPVLLFCYNGFSQSTEAWVARYNGPDNKNDQGRLIATDASGNVIVTGTSGSKKSSFACIATVKYSPAGAQLNAARYLGPSNGLGNEYPYGLTLDNAGNVYITGRSMGNGSNVDIVTIKYNASLQQLWAVRYNGPENLNDFPGDIKVDASGNVYVTGYTDSDNTIGVAGAAILTIKYNSSGVQEWVSRFPEGGPENGQAGKSLALDENGNIYVTGQAEGLVTIKYNSAGQLIWSRNGNGANGRKVLIDGAGNIVVASWGSDFVTVKYNSGGELLWESYYNGTGNGYDAVWDMALDASDNVYVTGISSNGANNDYATVKYNSNGVQQWASRYDGSGNDRDHARAIAVDGSGNAYVTGFTYAKSGRNFLSYYGTVKYASATGNQEWVAIYKGPDNGGSEGFDVALDGSGNVYVTGQSAIRTNFDYATIKYSQGTASRSAITDPISDNNSIGAFKLSIYPNPFSQMTTIEYELTHNAKVKLTLYDLLGKESAILVNENQPAGIHKININANKLSAGVYICSMQAGDFVGSRKIIVVK